MSVRSNIPKVEGAKLVWMDKGNTKVFRCSGSCPLSGQRRQLVRPVGAENFERKLVTPDLELGLAWWRHHAAMFHAAAPGTPEADAALWDVACCDREAVSGVRCVGWPGHPGRHLAFVALPNGGIRTVRWVDVDTSTH